MFIYYNANPKNEKVGDCVVRAISLALDIDYDIVVKLLINNSKYFNCDLLVKDCYVNSACDCFRLGGKNIHILNSRMIGPGKYPHRVSTAKGKNIELPDSDGRRNTNVFFCFFATEVYPMDSENIVIENCEISGVDRFLYDSQEFCVFQTGGIIKDFTLKNVTVNGLKEPSLYNTKTLFRFENLNADDENKYLILPKQQ